MNRYFRRIANVPRIFVLFADFCVIVVSFALSYFVLKQFRFNVMGRGEFFVYTAVYSCCALLVFYFMQIHAGLIRYSTIVDMVRIFTAIFLSSATYFVVDYAIIRQLSPAYTLKVPRILFINLFVSSSGLLMMRIGVRAFYYYMKKSHSKVKERILVYGTDQESIVIKQSLELGANNNFHVIGFLSAQRNIFKLHIQQKTVYAYRDLPELKTKRQLDKLIITNEDLAATQKQAVIDRCLELGIKVLTVPPSNQWIYGQLKLKQIQDLKIEDLLQREPIEISDVNIFKELSGKRILVTGAAGSIGSEIVRQVLRCHPAMVILCDQAESYLHEIQLEAEGKYPKIPVKTHICSIINRKRARIPFQEYFPEIVFHAAAYKHVPMMENHPEEAVLTNVLGTRILADLAVQYGVLKFVMISTDKAVNPTNIMGASKRIAEMYIQSLNNDGQNVSARFITTRFGNVLDSNGSVIPRFRSQIQGGGPITVTHPDIVRYFMTIPEAVQLVLEAGAMGSGGEIFVFDMGKPVKILDLAKNMVKLAGLTVDRDIKIVITGLRPGEKLYEELLNDQETVIPTYHEKIKIARTHPLPFSKIEEQVAEVIAFANKGEVTSLVTKMKEIVPDFKSENSIYQFLDNEYRLSAELKTVKH